MGDGFVLAAAEFLDEVANEEDNVFAAVAHLYLGRVYAMQGDTPEAKVAYQNFLTLWKDADPDTPSLKQAKAEYSKLQ